MDAEMLEFAKPELWELVIASIGLVLIVVQLTIMHRQTNIQNILAITSKEQTKIELAQVRIQQEDLKFQMFDKRFEVYDKIIGYINFAYNNPFSLVKSAELSNDLKGAHFLFGGSQEIQQLLRELGVKIALYIRYNRRLEKCTNDKSRDTLIGQLEGIEDWFSSSLDNLGRIFEPFLTLNHVTIVEKEFGCE